MKHVLQQNSIDHIVYLLDGESNPTVLVSCKNRPGRVYVFVYVELWKQIPRNLTETRRSDKRPIRQVSRAQWYSTEHSASGDSEPMFESVQSFERIQ